MEDNIKDEKLIQYVNDRLSYQDRKQLHKKAIDNGETDLLLNCVVANYLSQKDYADELLGEDDFVIDNSVRNIKELPFEQFKVASKKNPKH